MVLVNCGVHKSFYSGCFDLFDTASRFLGEKSDSGLVLVHGRLVISRVSRHLLDTSQLSTRARFPVLHLDAYRLCGAWLSHHARHVVAGKEQGHRKAVAKVRKISARGTRAKKQKRRPSAPVIIEDYNNEMRVGLNILILYFPFASLQR